MCCQHCWARQLPPCQAAGGELLIAPPEGQGCVFVCLGDMLLLPLLLLLLLSQIPSHTGSVVSAVFGVLVVLAPLTQASRCLHLSHRRRGAWAFHTGVAVLAPLTQALRCLRLSHRLLSHRLLSHRLSVVPGHVGGMQCGLVGLGSRQHNTKPTQPPGHCQGALCRAPPCAHLHPSLSHRRPKKHDPPHTPW